MTTDRELLELAAKAAGIELKGWTSISGEEEAVIGYDAYTVETWNPLTDDGDEARLEAQCGLDVAWRSNCVFVGPLFFEAYDNHAGDKQAARRRAGVRAAAAIGESLP